MPRTTEREKPSDAAKLLPLFFKGRVFAGGSSFSRYKTTPSARNNQKKKLRIKFDGMTSVEKTTMMPRARMLSRCHHALSSTAVFSMARKRFRIYTTHT